MIHDTGIPAPFEELVAAVFKSRLASHVAAGIWLVSSGVEECIVRRFS